MGRATHSQAADGLRLVTIEAATVRCEKALIFLGHGFSRSHVRDLTIHGQVPEEVSKPYQRAGQFVQVRTIAIWTSFYVILCHFHQDGLEHWNKPSHIFEAPKIVVLLQKIDHKPRASKHVPRSWQWRQLCLSKNPFKQLHVNFTFFYPRCRKLDESTCNNSQPARCHCPL